MNKKFKVSLISIIISVIIFFLGYLFGRSYGDKEFVEKEITKWKVEQLPPIHDTITYPIPYCVIDTDTVEKIINHSVEVDTLQILADYYRLRQYDLDFSNDSIGVFKVNIDVTKNSIAKATSDIRPIRTVVETTKYVSKVKNIQFYTLLGSSLDFKTNEIQFGIDLRQKYLIGASVLRFEDRYKYMLDLGIKF